MAIFYFVNWIVDTETIERGKLFKKGNYSRKYGSWDHLFSFWHSSILHKKIILCHTIQSIRNTYIVAVNITKLCCHGLNFCALVSLKPGRKPNGLDIRHSVFLKFCHCTNFYQNVSLCNVYRTKEHGWWQ